jgi:cytochrome c553
MKRNRSGIGLVAIVFFWAGWVAFTSTSSASLPMQKKAKELGIAGVTDCMSCHGEKLPKKGAMTLSDRGKWLVAEKEKRGAKEVDVAWLKDYTGK